MMDLPRGQSIVGESGVRCVCGPLFIFCHIMYLEMAYHMEKKCGKLDMYQNIFIFNLLLHKDHFTCHVDNLLLKNY